jgi:hypothetical protein
MIQFGITPKEKTWVIVKNIPHGRHLTAVPNTRSTNAENACGAKTPNSIASTGPHVPFI